MITFVRAFVIGAILGAASAVAAPPLDIGLKIALAD